MAKKRRSSQFKDSSQVIDIEEARRKRQQKRSRQHKLAKAGSAVSQKPERASIKQNKRRRMLIYAAIIVSIIAVVGVSVFNIISLKQEQKEIKKQQELLQEEKAEKEKELENINDPEYIEEQARAQLRLVLPGEKIYVFPSLDESGKESGTKNGKTGEN